MYDSPLLSHGKEVEAVVPFPVDGEPEHYKTQTSAGDQLPSLTTHQNQLFIEGERGRGGSKGYRIHGYADSIQPKGSVSSSDIPHENGCTDGRHCFSSLFPLYLQNWISVKMEGENVDNTPQPIWKIVTVASIAAGIQFGWALQLSLLTPYVQTLGVPHMWASFIWLCGPLSGFLVQPIVGYFSDRTTNKFGRRRPFILAGASFVAVAVILIGFAKDIGYKAGDDINKTTKPRAVAIFVVGFWVLDVANNMLQGPCRAFLADMSGDDHSRMRIANNCFSFFMAVGNVLGYAAGSLPKLYKFLPFTVTVVCNESCANLKSLFLIDVVFLITIVAVATSVVKETPLSPKKDTGASDSSSPIGGASSVFKSLSKKMWLLYAVTAVNWIAWFPWLLFDTDWMGLEVYGGKPQGTALEKNMYDTGVRAGSLGLMLNAIVLAVASLLVEPMSRLVGGVKRWWCIVNFILGIGLVLTVPVTKAAEAYRAVHGLVLPSANIKGAALGVFSLLGIPLAVNFSVPFALASIYSNTLGGGQGLSLGLLNLAIVIPQIIVSLVSGFIDNSFGGGNLPAFIMGAIASFVSALMALLVLPDTPSTESIDLVAGGGH